LLGDIVIGHTDAFGNYRTLSQGHINFAVAVCHAMPALRADLALPAPTLPHPPDYFSAARNPKSEVAAFAVPYQEELARSTLIAVFSYFEAYTRDAFLEIIKFHGGAENIQQMTHDRLNKFIASTPASINMHKRKLQDKRAPQKYLKYRDHAEFLDQKGFRFPTDLFALFGITQLLTRLEKESSYRAWEIPTLLEQTLLFPITKAEKDRLEEIRLRRNHIAHGKAPTIALGESLRYASELHTLAAKIDRHIAEHFLVIQVV
jgi:hypothetical protein